MKYGTSILPSFTFPIFDIAWTFKYLSRVRVGFFESCILDLEIYDPFRYFKIRINVFDVHKNYKKLYPNLFKLVENIKNILKTSKIYKISENPNIFEVILQDEDDDSVTWGKCLLPVGTI